MNMRLLRRSLSVTTPPTDLREEFAAAWDQLEIHGQDIVSTESFDLFATEALLRWRRNPHELWAAGMILPIAEDAGRVAECTQWATQLSLTAWASSIQRTRGGRLCLNLHPTQLARPHLVSELTELCAALDIGAHELIFEIPDRIGAEGCRAGVDTLGPLIDNGAIVALDDHRGSASDTRPNPDWLPPGSIVKLDTALTMAADEAIGRDLLEMTADELHAHGYNLVAEAIERPSQLAAIQHCHIGKAQGFLFAKPGVLR